VPEEPLGGVVLKAVFTQKRRIEMVMKMQGTDDRHQLDICIHRDERRSHTGQDPLQVREVVHEGVHEEVHGRLGSQCGVPRMSNRTSLVIEAEGLDTLFIDSFIDERLLTGDLEEDISILNIVA